MFQAILSNFDFFTPDPPVTTENEITLNMAWCKFWPKNVFVQTFFNFFSFSLPKVISPEQKIIQIQNYLNQNAL